MNYLKRATGSAYFRAKFVAFVLTCASFIQLASCTTAAPPPPKEPTWPTLPREQVQDFMKGTLFERIRFSGLDEQSVYGYSLVVNLHNTGGSLAPRRIREYIVKEINLRGLESEIEGIYHGMPADEMLKDKRVAIVTIEGRIPVGARSGQSFDVIVRALPRSGAKSLAHGELYQTDLSDIGLADPTGIGAHRQASVHGGPVFVNPAYALSEGATTQPGTRSSLLVGTVLNGGVVRFDRPIVMQLREPSTSTARLIESIISRRWQAPTQIDASIGDNGDIVAKAIDEGLVQIYVPQQYRGDWKHFLGVVSHLYLNQSPEFTVSQTMRLVAEAKKPHVSVTDLADISLCWEAMGPDALASFEPLISNPNPNVAYAAARAAAFLEDRPAKEALLRMAIDSSNPNQLAAVQTLGALPQSHEVDHMIAQLLDSDRTDIRIEAYHLLADNGAQAIGFSGGAEGGVSADSEYGLMTANVNGKFLLDIVPSHGTPMVYATSTGVPRIAVFGHNLSLRTPITFATMNYRFTISSSDGTSLLTLFYRDPLAPNPVSMPSRNELPEILRRLGGENPDVGDHFDFTFSDVVAISQELVAEHKVYGTGMADTMAQEGIFELQHPHLEASAWTSIPSDTTNGRPNGEGGVIAAESNSQSVNKGIGG